MKQLKKTLTLSVLLTAFITARTFGQDLFSSFDLLGQIRKMNRAKMVIQDNGYIPTGLEQGNFYQNPLMLNGKAMDYGVFGLGSKGELTVVKGAALTGNKTEVPFYVYLRRNKNKLLIPGKEVPDVKQTKIDLPAILKYARPDDELVIEPVNKEDGPVKRILKLLGDGC